MDTTSVYQAAKAALRKTIPGETTVGFIGLGVMGTPMCKNLMRKGFRTRVYNRTLSKCEQVNELGATICRDYADVGRGSDVVISIVGNPDDVKEVYLGERGVFSTLRVGGVAIDMTTSSPQLAQALNAVALEKGIFTLDAPCTGGDVGARDGRLSVMAAGEKAVFEAVFPLFEAMASNINFVGRPGNGQQMKISNQIMVASTVVGMVEGLLYAERAGLDLEQTLRAVSTGAAASWTVSTLGRRILEKDYDTGFYVEHFVKDLGIALEEARALKIGLPGVALAQQLFVMVQAQGFNKKGIQSLKIALARMNNMRGENVAAEKH